MRTYTVTEYEKEGYAKARDEMTTEEVINNLEYIDRGWIPDYGYNGTETDFENYKLHVAIWKAINVLSERMSEVSYLEDEADHYDIIRIICNTTRHK